MNKLIILSLTFVISYFSFAEESMNHDHEGQIHGALVDGSNLDVDPERYKEFMKGLENCQIAVVSVIGMVCDFCAQGEYGDFHTWIMVKSKKNDLLESWSTFPVLKFFKGNFLIEFGYNNKTEWDSHVVYRF